MRSPHEIKAVIESRLKVYLSRDQTGVRRAMLKLFLRMKTLTIAKICEHLNRRFSISYHSVAAMVGIIASRIGILHVMKNKEGTHSIYQLKEQYVDLVSRIVG
ncbi:MAG TPA: DUF2551 domain-containing protein [Methanolinea sp.]|jgi:hypothetical protein|nr:DUF2551 domain-containing protein [Methanolinea sp.]HOS82802.1 DUF2551 domain-containing protein [Methanolinea sp.]HPC55887.1 DUF2551 domain-containing protein [Methanolinea sp.]HQE86416.1 DUF2551 domain-containing protein [Methanolinea sp.]HQI14418.1 DUF2551 domain-containing protein [Methanolinea sp.]